MNLEKEIFDLELKDIMPNRFQPREVFDDEALQELSQSIKEHGVIQPIVVRKVGDKYEIIAGERRYRASLLAGKQTIPAMVSTMDDREAAKVALIENLQRKDLTAIEEAKTYQTILKLDNMTQEELAQNLGKSQSAIANKLRLLNLDDKVQTALLNGEISERHARSLLNLQDKEEQVNMLNKIIQNRMTVRQLDEEISTLTGKEISSQDAIVETPIIENQDISFKEPEAKTVNEPQINIAMPEPNISETNPNNIDNIVLENNPINNIVEEKPSIINNEEEIEKQEPDIGISFAIKDQTRQEMSNYNIDNNTVKEEQQILNIPLDEQKIQEPYKSVFDAFREPEENKLEAPEENTTQIIQEMPIEYDMRFAINNFRQAIQNTEKFGFKVNKIEKELPDRYQIVIDIMKNKDE